MRKVAGEGDASEIYPEDMCKEVGAPLPLISYGGTAMLTVFVGLGVVTSACIHDRPTPE